jgi:hypothetical protein
MLSARNGQNGVALMSSLFFLIIVTVLASTAIMLSTVQMKVASSVARWESGLAVAEGAVNYVIPLIQYIHYESRIPNETDPNGYCATLVPACVAGTAHPLITELQTTFEDDDVENLHILPSSTLNFNGLDVSIDIDSVGSSLMAGGGIEASWAYHGGAYSSSMLKAYKVTVTASTLTGSSRARMNQVIWLRAIM